MSGLAHRTAVEHVRVARALAAWPRLVAEMGAGRLCYSHVRVISRITGDGTAELVDDLINLAEHGTVAQLESTVHGLRGVRDSHRSDEPPREYATPGWTDAGQWRMSTRLHPERGARVETALHAIADAEGINAADALVRLAEIGMATLAAGGNLPRRGEEDATIVIHVDADSVPSEPRSRERDDEPAHRPFARIQDGPGLPDEIVERLACIGRIRTAVRDGTRSHSDVLDLGRTHRVVTARQFKALLLRDGRRCARPGCRSRRNLEAHHVRHWLYGGRTDMNNLILLCEAHHHAHHHGEFVIRPLGAGRFSFYRNGAELPHRPDPASFITTDRPVEDEHDHVASSAATPRWDGTRLDRDFVVWAIAPDLNLTHPETTAEPRSRERAG